jgi:hypothetical protein
MGTQGAQVQMDRVQGESQIQQWSVGTRVVFRFCFVYFGLYCFFTQIASALIPVVNVDVPELSSFWPMRHIVTWSAAHILRIAQPVTYVEAAATAPSTG